MGPLVPCVFLLLAFAAGTASAEEVLYDQRQNGSENVRVHMSDVSFVLAPAEALLTADLLSDQALPKPKNRPKLRLPNILMNIFNRAGNI